MNSEAYYRTSDAPMIEVRDWKVDNPAGRQYLTASKPARGCPRLRGSEISFSRCGDIHPSGCRVLPAIVPEIHQTAPGSGTAF